MFGLGAAEAMIIGIVAVMLFGSRLPVVARQFGQSIVEFKRGFLEVSAECKKLEEEASE
jgi:TatA/E family protein of Tat protein translocase